MATNLYVGNLPYDVSSEQLSEIFSAFGEVASVRVITDRDSGRSKGFGFVEMATEEGAQAAITQLNNTQLQNRTLIVNEARPREERSDKAPGSRQRRNDGYTSERPDRRW